MSAGASEAEAVERLALRMEQLLEQLQHSSSPTAWQRVEELARVLVELYGRGLSQLVAHARQAARDPAAFAGVLAEDPVLSALLSVHDLHPEDTRERVQGALAATEQSLSEHGASFELVELRGDSATIRVLGATDDGLRVHLGRAVAHAVERAAPELALISVENVALAGDAGRSPPGFVAVERLTERRQ